MINDLWYKNAVVYCLSVATYMDANADGIGDFPGLMRRLDYLHGLGVTAVWLMPFQPSPGKDDGYDISDYYGVNPAYSTIGDFVEFTHAAIQIRNTGTGISGPTESRPMPQREWCFPACRNQPGATIARPSPGIFTD